MIVAEQKPIKEILQLIDGYKKVLVLGCGTCVTVCLAGGEKEAVTMASILQLRSSDVDMDTATIERQCDKEFFKVVKKQIEDCDAVLSMACGVGVQLAAQLFPDKPILPGLNTKFMGTNDEAGQWSENCLACGDCKLGVFGAICPVTRCSKSLSNGPCGGSSNGMCEVDTKNIECGWHLICERLQRLGRVDVLEENAAPRDWSKTHSGGPRTLSREDIAGL